MKVNLLCNGHDILGVLMRREHEHSHAEVFEHLSGKLFHILFAVLFGISAHTILLDHITRHAFGSPALNVSWW